MHLATVLSDLNLDASFAAILNPHWDESIASLPEKNPALDPAEFLPQREFCTLGPEVDAVLIKTALRIAADPALRLVFWHFCRTLYDYPRSNTIGRWPFFDRQLGEDHAVFYLLAGLVMVPRVRALHASLKIPESVTRDTTTQVRCFCDEMYRRGSGGRPGIFLSQVYWFRNYTDGWLFRLGRMEYMLRPFGNYLEAFRHRSTGATVALAREGFWVDAAGIFADAEFAQAHPECWKTAFTRLATSVRGSPISPLGFVQRPEITLPLAEWDRVLAPGDLSMEMHIPAGGGMPPELCLESLRRGFEFFARYFPDRPVKVTSCQSWIFNTQLFEILPPEANLNRFMRELYLFPLISGPNSGLFFVFFQESIDLATAPETTSLQRAVKKFLLAGNRWRGGGMFFLKDDLERFGSQLYRSAKPIPY